MSLLIKTFIGYVIYFVIASIVLFIYCIRFSKIERKRRIFEESITNEYLKYIGSYKPEHKLKHGK